MSVKLGDLDGSCTIAAGGVRISLVHCLIVTLGIDLAFFAAWGIRGRKDMRVIDTSPDRLFRKRLQRSLEVLAKACTPKRQYTPLLCRMKQTAFSGTQRYQ